VLVNQFRRLGLDIDPVDTSAIDIGDEDLRAGRFELDSVGSAHDLRRVVQVARLRELSERSARPIGLHQAQAIHLVGDHNAEGPFGQWSRAVPRRMVA